MVEEEIHNIDGHIGLDWRVDEEGFECVSVFAFWMECYTLWGCGCGDEDIEGGEMKVKVMKAR